MTIGIDLIRMILPPFFGEIVLGPSLAWAQCPPLNISFLPTLSQLGPSLARAHFPPRGISFPMSINSVAANTKKNLPDTQTQNAKVHNNNELLIYK